MRGEALTIHVSLKAGFREELVGPVLEGGDAETPKCVQEFAPREPCDLGGPALRDEPELVPLDGCREPQLLGETLRVLVEGCQSALGHFDRHSNHVLISDLYPTTSSASP